MARRRGRSGIAYGSALVAPGDDGSRAPVVPSVAPDRGRRLSEGALVQASVRARVLGVPLLRLEATVVLMPAAMTAPPGPVGPPTRASAGSSGVPAGRSGAAGHGLAEAVRSINEGAELLAEVRRNGS
jgi:hypothetical protein